MNFQNFYLLSHDASSDEVINFIKKVKVNET